MGLELDIQIVISTLKVKQDLKAFDLKMSYFLQRPYGPAIGVVCQFILMPVFAYLLGYLLLETTYERLGLLLIGCAPGGANSNFWVIINDDMGTVVQYQCICRQPCLTEMSIYQSQ